MHVRSNMWNSLRIVKILMNFSRALVSASINYRLHASIVLSVNGSRYSDIVFHASRLERNGLLSVMTS